MDSPHDLSPRAGAPTSIKLTAIAGFDFPAIFMIRVLSILIYGHPNGMTSDRLMSHDCASEWQNRGELGVGSRKRSTQPTRRRPRSVTGDPPPHPPLFKGRERTWSAAPAVSRFAGCGATAAAGQKPLSRPASISRRLKRRASAPPAQDRTCRGSAAGSSSAPGTRSRAAPPPLPAPPAAGAARRACRAPRRVDRPEVDRVDGVIGGEIARIELLDAPRHRGLVEPGSMKKRAKCGWWSPKRTMRNDWPGNRGRAARETGRSRARSWPAGADIVDVGTSSRGPASRASGRGDSGCPRESGWRRGRRR